MLVELYIPTECTVGYTLYYSRISYILKGSSYIDIIQLNVIVCINIISNIIAREQLNLKLLSILKLRIFDFFEQANDSVSQPWDP